MILSIVLNSISVEKNGFTCFHENKTVKSGKNVQSVIIYKIIPKSNIFASTASQFLFFINSIWEQTERTAKHLQSLISVYKHNNNQTFIHILVFFLHSIKCTKELRVNNTQFVFTEVNTITIRRELIKQRKYVNIIIPGKR